MIFGLHCISKESKIFIHKTKRYTYRLDNLKVLTPKIQPNISYEITVDSVNNLKISKLEHLKNGKYYMQML